MPITRIYNGSNRTILNFRDSELRRRGLPVFVSNSNISYTCSDARISRALRLQHVNGNHEISIDWSLYSMTSPEVTFDIFVAYSGNTRISERVQLIYPLLEVGFRTELSLTSGTWGVQPNCILSIRPNINQRDAWRYKDKKVKLSFSSYASNYFFPVDKHLDREFMAKEGIEVPLQFIFDKKPLTAKLNTCVSFRLNDDIKSLQFSFEPNSPNANSYTVELERLKQEFKYGSNTTEIFKVQARKNSDFVSPVTIQSVDCSITNSPFIHKYHKGEHFICIDSSKLHWPEMDTTYNVSIVLSNSLKYTREIHITPHDNLSGLNYVQILPGNQPHVQIFPNNRFEMYIGGREERCLHIENTSAAPITVQKINSSDNSYRFDGRPFTIQSGKSRDIIFFVIGDEIGNKNIDYRIRTKETEVAIVSLKAKVLPLDDAPVTAVYETLDNYQLIYEPNFSENAVCGKILVSYSYTKGCSSPFTKDDFKIDDENFDIRSTSRKDDCNFEYVIGVKKGAFAEEKKLPEPKEFNGELCYPLSWLYHDKKGVVMIPFKKPVYYAISNIDVENVTFPSPGDSHRVKVCDIELSTPEKFCSIIDDEQILSINAPFSFEINNTEKSILEVTGTTNAIIYLNVDKLDGINANTLNIDSPIELNIELTRKSKRKGERVTSKNIQLIPIDEKEKRRVYFVSSDNKQIELVKNITFNTEIQIFEQSDDVLALTLGVVHVANLSKIPSGNHAVRRKINNISATVGGKNILHIDSAVYVGQSIEVYNGDSDFEIPITIDYQLWKQYSTNESVLVYFELEKDNGTLIKYNICIDIIHEYVDDVYALDLGTTGIVVAKERDGVLSLVTLEDDKHNPIEKDKEIISSHTMIIAEETKNSCIKLAPSGEEYYGQTEKIRYRLVPSKFIIGQSKIPYLEDFYNNDDLNKTIETFDLKDNDGELLTLDLSILNNNLLNEQTISSLIASLYEGIFNRFGKDVKNIKKLIITYPNTYTIENLDGIKQILQNKLGLVMNGQVSFVPESDAVVAYYFNQKIRKDKGFFDTNDNPRKETNVIIYDMGAGTLDLSLVSFKQSENGNITASIINKIGIPLAGNYLDYLIFRALKDSGNVEYEEVDRPTDKNLINKHSTIHKLTEEIKRNYVNSDVDFSEYEPDWYAKYQNVLDEKILESSYSKLFSENLKDFVTICGETVLKLLIPDTFTIHTIVFSGRGSKFSSLRESSLRYLKSRYGENEIVVDELKPFSKKNTSDHLKTCVAVGALKYQGFFLNNEKYNIENRNIYSKLAVVYLGQVNNVYGAQVKFLVNPQTENWSDAEMINGTLCKEFAANVEISNHISHNYIYYVQTCLNEEMLKTLFNQIFEDDEPNEDDLNWAFVNILYKIRITDSKPFEVGLKISKSNKIIDRKIGDIRLIDTKLLEHVEDNILYKRSMWPFITTLDD